MIFHSWDETIIIPIYNLSNTMSISKLASESFFQKSIPTTQSWATISEEEDEPILETPAFAKTWKLVKQVEKEQSPFEEETDDVNVESHLQFPPVGQTPDEIRQKRLEHVQALERQNREKDRKRNAELSKLQKINILYGPNKSRIRSLDVTSAQNFNHHLKVSDMMKTHNKGGFLNNGGKDMKDKIKLANGLLKQCYKHPTKPFCFVYVVAEVDLGDKVIRVNELKPTNIKPFNVVELEYYIGSSYAL
jgi:hypothetical protein